MPVDIDPEDLKLLRPRGVEIGKDYEPYRPHGRVIGSLLRGIDNLQGSLYGTGALLSDLSGGYDTEDWFIDQARRNEAEATQNPAYVQTFRDIWEPDSTLEKIGNGFTYAIEGVMENVPMMVPGFVMGGGAGFLASKGAQAMAAGMGAYAGSWMQEAGSIYNDILKNTGKKRPVEAAAFGGFASIFDALSEIQIGAKLLPKSELKAAAGALGMGLAKEVEDRLIKRVGKSAAESFLFEGTTEGIQTLIEHAAQNYVDPTKPFWTQDTIDDLVDSILKGGLAGGGFGALGGLHPPEEGGAARPGGPRTPPKPGPAGVQPPPEPVEGGTEPTPGTAGTPGTPVSDEAKDLKDAGAPGTAAAVEEDKKTTGATTPPPIIVHPETIAAFEKLKAGTLFPDETDLLPEYKRLKELFAQGHIKSAEDLQRWRDDMLGFEKTITQTTPTSTTPAAKPVWQQSFVEYSMAAVGGNAINLTPDKFAQLLTEYQGHISKAIQEGHPVHQDRIDDAGLTSEEVEELKKQAPAKPPPPGTGQGDQLVRDFSESARLKRLEFRKELTDVSKLPKGLLPDDVRDHHRWLAIQNDYIKAKAAQEALPGVPLKDVQALTIYRKTPGVTPGDSEVVDYFFVPRNRVRDLMRLLEGVYPVAQFGQMLDPSMVPYSPRKGEPLYREWLAGKRPQPPQPSENQVTPPSGTPPVEGEPAEPGTKTEAPAGAAPGEGEGAPRPKTGVSDEAMTQTAALLEASSQGYKIEWSKGSRTFKVEKESGKWIAKVFPSGVIFKTSKRLLPDEEAFLQRLSDQIKVIRETPPREPGTGKGVGEDVIGETPVGGEEEPPEGKGPAPGPGGPTEPPPDEIPPGTGPAPTPTPPTTPTKEAEDAAILSQAADQIAEKLLQGPITRAQADKIVAEAFGGTAAQGRFTAKDVTDAVELAMNRIILRSPGWNANLDDNWKADLDSIEGYVKRLPTQTTRSVETDRRQQFSTPPHIAYVANWVAAVQPGDVMLEPSAGIGGLAAFAKLNGATTVLANELSPRRAAILEQLGVAGEVTRENAEHLNAILEPKIQSGEIQRPTVVVMNPPFSAAAHTTDKSSLVGTQHVEQAMNLLAPGGRLVAILGEGMAADRPAMAPWWAKMQRLYHVRANLGLKGEEYAKYGTKYPVQVIVIDKTESTGQPPIVTRGEERLSVREAASRLQEIRNDRPEPASTQPSGAPEDQGGGGGAPSPGPADTGAGPTRTGPRQQRPRRPKRDTGDSGHQPPDTGAGTTTAGGERPGTPGHPGDATGGTGGTGGVLPGTTPPATGPAEHPTPPGVSPPAKGDLPGILPEDQAEAAAALAELQKLLGQTNIGADPKILLAGARYGALLIKSGVRKFGEFARKFKTALGSQWDAIKKFLHSIWGFSTVDTPDAETVTPAEAKTAIAAIDEEKPQEPSPPPEEKKPERQLGPGIFTPYESTLDIPGAQPHPTPLVEPTAMAAVKGPAVTYQHSVPQDQITNGNISGAQMEPVLRAGQAHEQKLPNGERMGYFTGDGTGVGKTREILAIAMLDNWNKGRRQHILVSKNKELIKDLEREMQDLGIDPKLILNMTKGDPKAFKGAKEGLAFLTYPGLAKNNPGVINGELQTGRGHEEFQVGDTVLIPPTHYRPGESAESFVGNRDYHYKIISSPKKGTIRVQNVVSKEKTTVPFITLDRVIKQATDLERNIGRMEALYRWLGKDFDGVIIFDEAHIAGNAITTTSGGRRKDPSQNGLAVVDLQKIFPNARILYASATGATDVTNLAYAERLGLWGPNTAFPDKQTFFDQIANAGLSALEIVARDLKALGRYIARTLSYEGVQSDSLVHEITPEQTEMYNSMAEAWQRTWDKIDETMSRIGTAGNNRTANRIRNAYFATQQRFYNTLLTAIQLPTVIAHMKSVIAQGHSPVLQIVNTNEAPMERELESAEADLEEGEELAVEDLNLSASATLIDFIKNNFPTILYEAKDDGQGNIRYVQVLDSHGDPVMDPQAIAEKKALINHVRDLRAPSAPLEMILDTFGADQVAEITGRNKRPVRKVMPDGSTKEIIEDRNDTTRAVEKKGFEDDERRILIYSGKGGTGFSYHSGLKYKNQRQRFHYLLQAGWRADVATQGLGRTHRSAQRVTPHYQLVSTNLSGHQRFISTISRRMAELGALSGGERKAAAGGVLAGISNLETEYGTTAVHMLFNDLHQNRLEDFSFNDVSRRMGFLQSMFNPRTGEMEIRNRLLDPAGALVRSRVPDVQKFLNRILNFPVHMQNNLFQEFIDRMERLVTTAKEQGNYDMGVQTVHALELRKVSDVVVHTVPGTTATTHLIEVDEDFKKVLNTWDDAHNAIAPQTPVTHYVRNIRSGFVYALKEGPPRTLETGAVIPTWRRIGVKATDIQGKFTVNLQNVGPTPANYQELTKEQAEAAWNQEHATAPKVYTVRNTYITGAFLPIWDRVQLPNFRVYKLPLSTGETELGIWVHPDRVSAVRGRLNAGQEAPMSPDDVYSQVLEQGRAFTLANDWRIERSMVLGDPRIEIENYSYRDERNLQGHHGAFLERIAGRQRAFVPTEPVAGKRVIASILAQSPIVPDSGPSQGPTAGSRTTTVEEAPQRAISQETAEDEVSKALGGEVPSWIDVIHDPSARSPDGAHAAGWYDPETGKVVINAAMVGSRQQLRRVLQEELLHAVRNDPQVQRAWNNLLRSLTPEQREEARAKYPSASQEVVDEEAAIAKINDLTLTPKQQSLWKKFWQSIKDAIARLPGVRKVAEVFGADFTESDARELVGRAWERGRMEPAPIGEGERMFAVKEGEDRWDYDYEARQKVLKSYINRARKGGVVSDFADIFDALEPENLGSNALTELYYKLERLVGDVPVGPIKDPEKWTIAHYDPVAHQIGINTQSTRPFTGYANPTHFAETFVHEMVHAATMRQMLEHSGSKEVARLRELRRLIAEKWTAVEDDESKFADFDEEEKSDIAYGLTTVDEFIAAALSSTAFQRFLQSDELSDIAGKPHEGNFLKRLWQILSDLLGLDPNGPSLLAETLNLSERIMRQPVQEGAISESTEPVNAPPSQPSSSFMGSEEEGAPGTEPIPGKRKVTEATAWAGPTTQTYVSTTDAERIANAKRFVDENGGDDLQAAFDNMIKGYNRGSVEEQLSQLISEEILNRAGMQAVNSGTPIMQATEMITLSQRALEWSRGKRSAAGQMLQASQTGNKILGGGFLMEEWKTRMQRMQEARLAKKFPGVTSTLLKLWLEWSGNQVKEAARKVAANADLLVSRALNQARKMYGETWYEILTQSAKNQKAMRDEIYSRVRKHPLLQGLKEADIVELTDLLHDAWAKEREIVFKRELAKALEAGGVKKPDAVKLISLLPEFMKQLNLGLFSDRSFLNSLAPKYGIKAMTDEDAKRIYEAGQEAQDKPKGAQQDTAIQNVLNMVARSMGLPFTDILKSYWYASVLAGMGTQGRNFLGNAALLMDNMAAFSAREPKAMSHVIMGALRGFRMNAQGEFGAILKRGQVSDAYLGSDIHAASNPLEILARESGAWNKFLSQFKYVSRFMIAVDSWFYAANAEAQASFTAFRQGQKEGLSGAALNQYINKVLNIDPKSNAYIQAQAIAEREAALGLLVDDHPGTIARRRNEILRFVRPPDIQQEMKRFALEATLNNVPEGFVGWIANAAIQLRRVSPVFTPIIPFIRISANVTNMLLDHSPVGLAKLILARPDNHWQFLPEWARFPNRRLTPEQFQQLRAKVIISHAVMMALGAKAIAQGDDDDPDFQVTGTFRSLSPQQRRQLEAQGIKPYQVRVMGVGFDYRQTPGALLFAALGNYLDGVRYSKFGEKDNANELKIAAVMAAGTAVIIDQQFLSSLATIAGTAASGTQELQLWDKLMRQTARTVTGLIPQFTKEIDSWVEPTSKQANNFFEYMQRDIPVARWSMDNFVNVLGQPVERPRTPTNWLITTEEEDPVWQALSKKAQAGVFVPVPSASATVLANGKRIKMSEDAFNRYQEKVGQATEKLIRENVSAINSMTPAQFDTWIKKRTEVIRAQIRPTIH